MTNFTVSKNSSGDGNVWSAGRLLTRSFLRIGNWWERDRWSTSEGRGDNNDMGKTFDPEKYGWPLRKIGDQVWSAFRKIGRSRTWQLSIGVWPYHPAQKSLDFLHRGNSRYSPDGIFEIRRSRSWCRRNFRIGRRWVFNYIWLMVARWLRKIFLSLNIQQ